MSEMAGDNSRFFRFNEFVLDSVERELVHRGEPVPLTPKAFDTLEFLLRNHGHLVSKDELMAAIWPDSFVDEGNLPRTIHTLRKTLGENGNGLEIIKTVPTKGYRFVADVQSMSHLEGDSNRVGPAVIETEQFAENGHVKDRPAARTSLRILLAAGAFLMTMAVVGWFTRGSADGPFAAALTPQTKSGEAYQHFQLGRFYVERHLDGDLQPALENFDEAIELDPSYAAAYAGRADARIWMFWGSADASHDHISIARASINKALELDEANPYAHTLSARIKATYDWDFAGAEKECRRAIELDPTEADAHRELAMLLTSVGRADEAMVEIDRSVALAPTSFNKRSRGVILYFLRRYDDAIEQLKQVEETDPEYEQCSQFLFKSYEMKKDFPNALEYYLRLRQRKVTPAELQAIRDGFAAGGWESVLRDMKETSPAKNAFQYAGTLAQLGEVDAAFESLNIAAGRRRVMIVQAAREPRFDPLRADPRWQELMKRIGLQ